MASNKYKKRRIGFVILLLLLLLIAVGVITVTGEINGGKKTGETVTVSIAQGSGTSAIAQELKDAGLIGNTTLFKLYSRTHGGDGRYQYGDFTLEKGSSYQELIHCQLPGNGDPHPAGGLEFLPDGKGGGGGRALHRGGVSGGGQCPRL